MSLGPAPLERVYNLGRLGKAGAEVDVTANASELVQLARWAAVRSMPSFAARVALKRVSPSHYTYLGEFQADVVQDCVVTLEPVRSLLKRQIRRELHLAGSPRTTAVDDVVVEALPDDDEIREEITSLRYDLAGPLLEELALAIDPYPRAPGAAFVVPAKPITTMESPFAVLKNLKK